MKKIIANNDKNAFAKVDDDIFETIQEMNLKFSIDKYGYFYSTSHNIQLPGMIKKRKLYLHIFVWLLKTGTEPTLEVDHQDIDPGNNQYSNLRLATAKQQRHNQGRRKDNSSGYNGVSYHHQIDKRRKKNNVYHYWRAQIHKPSGQREQKYFPYTKNGKQHAAMWYDDRASEYYDDFAGELNFPMPTD